MAELFLSAVLPVLFEKLTSPELLDFATREGIRSKLDKLKKKLGLINALLIDAEMKLTDGHGAVKMWLDELQDLAYDAEDILDEYATEALTRKLKIEEHQASTSTARKLIPACCVSFTSSALRSNVRMRSEMDKITSRLAVLYNERTGLGLEIKNAGGRSSVSWQRPPTTYLPIETVVHGRDEDKAIILEMLRNETSDGTFGFVPILGMGGIGKTTLARQVYNDKAVEDFNLKAWVCVSDDFDVTRISKAILESITGGSCDLKDLNAVQSQLVKVVAGKRFLLVLDDVWSNNDFSWETLKAPFLCGAPGSKMIVTTRLQEVAKTVTPKGGYMLNILSHDDCWSLFKQHAFNGRDDVAHWNVEAIRQKVVQKCNGLPLAAKALGGLLCRKGSEDEWMEILDNKIWDISREDKILPVLKLSYYHLPSNLKRCFAYCAVFPKDYEFEEKELVFLWMAEGLIQQSRDNKPLEKLGGEYFRDLVSRSIFQLSSSNSSKFIMHDLVNDLAQMVSEELSFRLEGELKNSINQSKISEKTRYSSNICQQFYVKRNLEVFNIAKLLRTHLSVWLEEGEKGYICNSVVSGLLLKFKKLRVLSLQGYQIVDLPNSIGGMKLLRYLNLSYSRIKSLPESVNSMCNLQTLLLINCCHLSKLPYDMGKLINLRHLDISGASLIEKMSLGIRNWKSLRTLSNFIVGENSGSSLKDLKHLKFLCGQLHISNLENVIDFEDTREIILSDKKDLKVLLLEWRSWFDDSRNEEIDKKVLNILRPHRNLEELTIRYYGGTKFPSWVGDHNSFSKMTVLTLEGCMKCTSLPSLGLLGALKDLTIIEMTGLKSIGSEFYGDGCSIPFRSLETLSFYQLEEWEHWECVKGNGGVESFPKLRELSVIGCPKLSETLPSNLSLLEKLVIHNCPALVVSVSTFPMLCKLEIDGCKKIVCSSPTGSKSLNTMTLSKVSDFGNWHDFQRVDVLKVKGCDDLINLWQNEIFLEKPPHGLHSLISIRELCVENCKTLTTSLLEGIRQKNEHLETLQIEGCHSLTFIFRGQLPPSLKKLSVRDCEKLQCLLDENESSTYSSSSINVSSHSSHLVELEIWKCPYLTRLPLLDQFSATLTSLEIRDCSNLTTLWLPATLKSLKKLSIGSCKKLQCLLDENESSTYSSSSVNVNHSHLVELTIYECPSLTCLPLPDQFSATLTSLVICYCSNLTTLWLPVALKCLYIERCPKLTTLLPRDQLPETLETLTILGCEKLESVVPRFFKNTALNKILISRCSNLKSIPDGLYTLSGLREIDILNCQDLVSFPKGGFPNSILHVSITNCEKLKALPSQIHTLSSLRSLIISKCPSLSYPEEGFPANLLYLKISSPNLYKPLTNLGFHNLTSLIALNIHELANAESFHEEEMEMTLPHTLTALLIKNFPKLKCLSCKSMENLTSLEYLLFSNCPELTSLPNLPSSLLELTIRGCPLLKEACKRDKGKEWYKISDIPCVNIDYRFIGDAYEDSEM